MKAGTASYPEAVELLEALLEGVPETQYLEIRTLKKGGGGKKNFFKLSRLRQEGIEAALPGYLDGLASIYYGVAPRHEARQGQSGTDRGDAVNLATTLWLDEITLPPPDLPPFSWMVETSVGKYQAGFLLQEATADLDRVEQLNQRLGAAVGGDNVWNRGRILRLPGFINLNHPGEQRARLIEIHADRRYTLDEMDQRLPKIRTKETGGRVSVAAGRTHTGMFDPHWPHPLPPLLQNRLFEFFQGLNLRWRFDGRFSGPCPLPHQNGLSCDCESAFYASPVSGSWCCFCSDHLGQTSGTVRAFAPLGLVADLALSEIQAEIGKYHMGAGEARYRERGSCHQSGAPNKEDVADRVRNKKSIYPISDKPKNWGKRPSLWDEARELFPLLTHVKPWVKAHLLWSERDRKGLAVDLYSNTWRNPANAQYKRQRLYYNILPRINGPQIYQCRVPFDDWDEKAHRRISKAIQRAMTDRQGWLWFNNSLKRGYFLYLTSVPELEGFKPVEDARHLLTDALKSISPPGRDEEGGRFRPYGGSRNWVGNVGDTGEEDAGRWEIIAIAQGPTDFIGIEAECVVAGVATEYILPFWRGQLMKRHELTADDIEQIEVSVSKCAFHTVMTNQHPSVHMETILSLAAVYGEITFNHIHNPSYRQDPRFRSFRDRARIIIIQRHAPAMMGERQRMEAGITVRTQGGAVLSQELLYPLMSEGEIQQKFRDLVGLRVKINQLMDLERKLKAVETVQDVAPLISELELAY